jgi:hypothetical protein
MSGSFYDTAQICLNGHLINDNFRLYPVHNQRHCKTCGEPTITQCENCKEEIRGSYEVPGVAQMGAPGPPPNFCHHCGHSYPWTERRLEAAKYLAEEFDQLDEAEIEKLKGTLDDLVRETPKTELASTRFKKLMAKAGKESLATMKSALTDVLSETVKKSLFGG